MKPIVLTFNGKRLVDSSGRAIFRHGTTTINGDSYRTVKIGSQEWLAENFRYSDGGTGIVIKPDGDYAGDGYYTWDAAVRVASTAPDGWHLPSYTEWDALATAVGGSGVAGTKLKSTTGWSSGNGDDSYGFAAFPAGFHSSSFSSLGTHAFFWTATEYSSNYAYGRRFSTGASLEPDFYSYKTYCFSVRLIRSV